MATLVSPGIERVTKVGHTYFSKERLHVNSDRSKIVPETDKDVAFLLCPAGGEVSERDALRLGLIQNEDESTKVESPEQIATRSTRVPKNLATR